MKTKLGISAGLLASIIYCLALFGGYVPLLIVAGYVLIAEQNKMLKYVSVKAICVSLVFSLLYILVGLIPDACGLINSMVGIFDGYFNYSVVSEIEGFINNFIGFAEKVLLLLLAFSAFKCKDISISPLDSLINKAIKSEDEE